MSLWVKKHKFSVLNFFQVQDGVPNPLTFISIQETSIFFHKGMRPPLSPERHQSPPGHAILPGVSPAIVVSDSTGRFGSDLLAALFEKNPRKHFPEKLMISLN